MFRVVNVFLTPDRIDFRQEFSTDGVHWTAMAHGTETRVKGKRASDCNALFFVARVGDHDAIPATDRQSNKNRSTDGLVLEKSTLR
jgi:hypothetical protein